MSSRFSKHVFVTGAARGLGFALVQAYLKRGAFVSALVRNEEDRQRLLALMENGRGDVVVSDLRDKDSFNKLQSYFSRINLPLDLLINNAGLLLGSESIENLEIEDCEESFKVHCLAPISCVKAALPFLSKAESPTIANISSRFGSVTGVASGSLSKLRASYAYRISKAAQNMLTACLAGELNQSGITVLAVHPGKMATGLTPYPAANDLPAALAAERVIDYIDYHQGSAATSFFEPGKGQIAW